MLKRASESRPADDGYHPWTTYVDARQEARRRGDHKVGTEHLVLALLMEPPSKEMRRFGGRHPGPGRILAALLQLDRPDAAAELFARLGVDRAAARDRLAGL